MSEQSEQNEASPDSVNALLLPLTDRNLLLPRSALAELLNYNGRQAIERKSDWVLGHVEWSGHRLPLLSFEAFIRSGELGHGEDSRVAILHGVGGRRRIPYIALLIQGAPRSVVVDESLAVDQMVLSPFEMMAVKIGESVAVIPNLDALEQRMITTGLFATKVNA